ncbi:unnamed protein product [Diabrotica balteata]|uniref:Uncharacterized protein n=1 Tax=Diabrotica balteata TaxID=107213 RepID=A0A9N9TE26_DIABA|nr:unnamed protein product [Diabrotica balteata]
MSNRARLLVELALNSASRADASHQVPEDDNINILTYQSDDASSPQRTESTVPEPVEDLLENAELEENPVLTPLEVTEIPKETSHSKTDIAPKSYYLEQNTDNDIPIIDYQEEMTIEEENIDPFHESDSDSEYLPTETDTDSENLVGNQEDHQIPDARAKKRRSKGQRDPSQWKRAKNSQARLKGHAYMGFQKNSEGTYQQTAYKGRRQLKPSCGGHKNESKGPQQKFECSQITNEMRNQIFHYFWEINSWEGKQIYVSSLVLHSQPKHRRRNTVEEESRKKTGFKYYLIARDNKESSKKYHVCKKMFLATLGIGERSVSEWVSKKCLPNKVQAIRPVLVEPPQDSECTKNVNIFLDSLPKVESHYCRAFSRKLYLEPTWNSCRHLHRTNKNKSNLPLNARSCDENIENDMDYKNTLGNNSEENNFILRQRSPSTSSISSSSSSSSNSSTSSSSFWTSSSSSSSNREIEECNTESNNMLKSVNDNMKDEIAVKSSLQIESKPKAIELANINAKCEEGMEEWDFSSDDSIADPNYHIKNDKLSDSDETVEQNEENNILHEPNQNITRKRKMQPELWKTNVAKRLRNAGKEYVGKNNKVIRERRLGSGCTEKCKLKTDEKLNVHKACCKGQSDYICDRCLQPFSSAVQLEAYTKDCVRINETAIKMPEESNKMLKFKNFRNKIKAPFAVYADLESALKRTGDPKKPQRTYSCSSWVLL